MVTEIFRVWARDFFGFGHGEPPASWLAEHGRLPEPVAGPPNSTSLQWWTMRSMIADAVIDRIVYRSDIIHVEGDKSMRKRIG